GQPSFSVKLPTEGTEAADQAVAQAGAQQDAAGQQQIDALDAQGNLGSQQSADEAQLEQQRMGEFNAYAQTFAQHKAEIDERDRQLRAQYAADPEGGFRPGVAATALGLIGDALTTLGTGEPRNSVKEMMDSEHKKDLDKQAQMLKLLEMNGVDRKDL